MSAIGKKFYAMIFIILFYQSTSSYYFHCYLLLFILLEVASSASPSDRTYFNLALKETDETSKNANQNMVSFKFDAYYIYSFTNIDKVPVPVKVLSTSVRWYKMLLS